MKDTVAKLLSGLANFKTLTVVMFVILSILIINNMIPNDNANFYITIFYSVLSLCYVYNNLINNFTIKEINME